MASREEGWVAVLPCAEEGGRRGDGVAPDPRRDGRPLLESSRSGAAQGIDRRGGAVPGRGRGP
jgi:hypothetical protein